MSFPQLTALARNFAETEAEDSQEHAHNYERVCELAGYVYSKGAVDLGCCLEAASKLMSILAESTGAMDRGALKDLVSRALSIAESVVGQAEAPPTAEVEADEKAPVSEVVESASKAISESKPDELELNNGMVLGRLLVELGYATREQVAMGLKTHRRLGLPIGECLLMVGAVSPAHILEGLRIQERLRGGADLESCKQRADLDRQVRQQCEEKARGMGTGELELGRSGVSLASETVIGEILLANGAITNEDLEIGMHAHHFEGKRLGDALLEMGVVTQAELDEGLELQERLRHVAGL